MSGTKLSKFPQGLIIGVGASALTLVGLAWLSYDAGGKSLDEFQARLGELLLQLAVIVVIGGSVKAMFDWFQRRGARLRELAEQRRELAGRARAAHVVVETARELLLAHRSPATYSTQLQRLIVLRYEVEDLREDVKAGKELFARSAEIRDGLDGIVEFLKEAGEDYGPRRGHEHVDSGWKSKQPFDTTLVQNDMTWTLDFLNGGPQYQAYLDHLGNSKGLMRAEVYGA